ncbi:MAG: hypothetical protein IPG71_06120 [bacterium]|nr:hypothetical protein [bacterium]
MRFLTRVLRKAGLHRSERASGFTLYQQMIQVFIGSAILLGGWAAYRDLTVQWRLANVERQMDQYAHSAMGELVNTLQWSVGAQLLSSGRNPLLRIAIGEFIGENGGLNSQEASQGHFPYLTDNYFTTNQNQAGQEHRMYGGFIQLTHNANRGILINNREPYWAGREAEQYIWRGSRLRDPVREMAAFDRRDRMTVKSFTVDFPLDRDPALANEGAGAGRMKYSVMRITLVMQYRYQTTDWTGIYGEDYIRERVYETSVCPLNHGQSIEDNPFFRQFIQSGIMG